MKGVVSSKWQQRKAGKKVRVGAKELAANLRAVLASVKDYLHEKKLMRKGERY